MTPDDLTCVQRSWAALRDRRLSLIAELTVSFESILASPIDAASRAEWLCSAVEELVELLPAPSKLAESARAVGERWPDPLVAPSYDIDGRAWMAAASRCGPVWSETVEAAWRQAWLLLSDVLAAETLSPFGSRSTIPPQPT